MSATPDDRNAATTKIDVVIAAFIERGGEQEATELRTTGAAGLRRVLDLWFGREQSSSSPIPALPGRELVDRWTACLALLAPTAPEIFVDTLVGRRLGTVELGVLGACQTPGATRLLCEHVGDPDWLIRYNAVRSLIRIDDAAGKECITAALADDNLVVRSLAIKGVSRWDPVRAIGLYEAMLEASDLTPLGRQQAVAAIEQLRSGREVRDAMDPI